MNFDARRLDDWVSFWNTYDLSACDDLFLRDDRLTYFSSEQEGVLRGFDAVRAHHEGFGFVPGGRAKPTRLWLEEVHRSEFAGATIVSATWCFSKDGRPGIQRGPVTFVFVPAEETWRIAHAHFGNYPSRSG
jgi:hypothetical protein